MLTINADLWWLWSRDNMNAIFQHRAFSCHCISAIVFTNDYTSRIAYTHRYIHLLCVQIKSNWTCTVIISNPHVHIDGCLRLLDSVTQVNCTRIAVDNNIERGVDGYDNKVKLVFISMGVLPVPYSQPDDWFHAFRIYLAYSRGRMIGRGRHTNDQHDIHLLTWGVWFIGCSWWVCLSGLSSSSDSINCNNLVAILEIHSYLPHEAIWWNGMDEGRRREE